MIIVTHTFVCDACQAVLIRHEKDADLWGDPVIYQPELWTRVYDGDGNNARDLCEECSAITEDSGE